MARRLAKDARQSRTSRMDNCRNHIASCLLRLGMDCVEIPPPPTLQIARLGGSIGIGVEKADAEFEEQRISLANLCCYLARESRWAHGQTPDAPDFPVLVAGEIRDALFQGKIIANGRPTLRLPRDNG
jgi:hypothetical protein